MSIRFLPQAPLFVLIDQPILSFRKLVVSMPQISVPVDQPLSMSAIISLSVNGQETACAHMLIVAQAMLISPPPSSYVGR